MEFSGEFKARNIRLEDMGSRDSRMNDPGERGQSCSIAWKVAGSTPENCRGEIQAWNKGGYGLR